MNLTPQQRRALTAILELDRNGGSLEYQPWDVARQVRGDTPTGNQAGGMTRTLETLWALGLVGRITKTWSEKGRNYSLSDTYGLASEGYSELRRRAVKAGEAS